MIPGPILVYQCPDTGKQIFARSICSGNTFGATYWTDGHMDAPMLPDEQPFLISPHSGNLHWVEDLVLVEKVDFFNNNLTMAEIEKTHPGALWAWEESLMEAVLNHLESHANLTPKREEILRIFAWHLSNDPVRQDPPGDAIRTQEMQANMEKLEQILTHANQPDARLMRAELLRELGRFEESLALLKRVRSVSRKIARDTIRELARRKETMVSRLLGNEFQTTQIGQL